MQKFEQFQKAYDQAVATIHKFLEPGQYEPQMNGLVKWMLETDANPYSFLPYGWADALESAQGFASLLHHIHHAVYDDGDIDFVKVNGEPRIVFAWQHDDKFRDYVLTNQEKEIEKRPIFGQVRPYEIEVLDIKPNEFGPIYDAWQAEDIKRCFIMDASGHGVEWAAEHYRKYRCWNEEWMTECEDAIEARKALRKKAKIG